MTVADMKKEAAEHLKRFQALKAEIADAEEEAANIAFSQGSGDPVQSSSISDKTARGAAVLETVAEKRAWVDCIEKTMEWLKEERPDIYMLLYGHYGMRYRKGYRRKYAKSFTVSYCNVYHISDSEYKTRRIEGLDEVVHDATEAGLLKRRSSQT